MTYLINSTMKIAIVAIGIVTCGIMASAQSREINGKVTDDSGESLPGVYVIEKGNDENGTVTDNDGLFTLELKDSASVLVFSFLGMETQEINVAREKSRFLNVTMHPDAVMLDEMVVVGYGTLRKSDAATPTSTIREDDLSGRPLNSIENALQGKAAGVFVRTDSGEPGSGINVIIRGANSINGSNAPLYVVDGFPINPGENAVGDNASTRSNPLSYLNTYDIESIDILKDASATSIYGSRGSNGVILITTKQAKLGKTRVDFSSQWSISAAEMGYTLLNSYDYASMNNEVARLKYPGVSDQELIENNLLPYYGEAGDTTPSPENCTTSSDFLSAILRPAFSQNYQLTISGGNRENSYLMSIGYTSQEGVVLGSKMDKVNVRANLKNQLFPRVRLNSTVAVSSLNNSKTAGTGAALQTGPIYNALRMRPLVPIYENDGAPVSYDEDGNFIRNPVVEATKKYDEVYQKTGIVNLHLVINLAKGLTFNSREGFSFKSSTSDIFYPFATAQGQQLHGQARTHSQTTSYFSSENFLQYNRIFNKIHSLNAVLGVSYEQTIKNLRFTEQSNFTFDDLGINALGLGTDLTQITSNKTLDVLKSAYMRVNYSLMSRYILNFTGRADGSSKFGPNNKWGFFPSVSGAWRIAEEPFLDSWTFLDELKLRVSWGMVGNQAIPSYRTADTYTINKYFINKVGYTATYPAKLANPDLKWETTRTLDVGIDLSVFDNRLNLSADYFIKDTYDLLFEKTLPTSSSFPTAWVNMGRIQNQGFEIELSAYLFNKRNFKWDITANISSVKTIAKDLGDVQYINGPNLYTSLFTMPGHRLVEGEEVGLFYGYECTGLIQPEDFVDYYGGNMTPKMVDVTYVNENGETVTERHPSYVQVSSNHNTPGQWKFKDQNHDDILSENDMVRIGKAFPDMTFGLTTNFNLFRRWSISLFFQGATGFQIMNLTKAVTSGWIGANGRQDWYDKRWTLANPHNDVNYPAPGMNDAAGKINSVMIEDGDYIKLQNLSVRYSIPLGKAKYIKKCDVYFSGSNLFTITAYSGQDPEVNVLGNNFQTPGVDLGTYPVPRSFTLGVDLSF